MTAAELRTRFDIELDAVASAAAPGFTDDEKSEFLNKAQDMLIQLYSERKQYEKIYPLVKVKSISNINSIASYGSIVKYIDIDVDIADFRYYVSSRLYMSRNTPVTVDEEFVPCEFIEREYFGKFTLSGYNTPYIKYPKVFFEYNNAEAKNILGIVVDSYTTVGDAFELTYIKVPTAIDISGSPSVEPDLPESLHKDIVSLAVQEAVKSLYISKTPQTPRQ